MTLHGAPLGASCAISRCLTRIRRLAQLSDIAGDDRRQYIPRETPHPLPYTELEVVLFSGLEQRGVFPGHLFGRPPIGEIVQSERFARHAFGTLQRIGMTMECKVRRPENSQSIV